MKVTSLTPEQEALLPRYKELGIQIGLATGAEMDEVEVRRLTDAHRELCGVPKAENFLVLDSPFAAYAWNSELTPSNALYGQHDISWLIFYTFFRVECGLVEETEKIIHLLELAKRVGWMWMGNFTTVVTRRPVSIHLQPKQDGVSVLHNTEGMALSYKDGTGVYCLNGIRIPKEFTYFITDKSAIQAKEVFAISNTEIRSEIIKMLGPDFMMKHMKPVVLHKETITNGGDYELLELDIEGGKRRYLSGVCPSKGDRWWEAVPPEVSTCREALKWREWGQLGQDYLAPKVRT